MYPLLRNQDRDCPKALSLVSYGHKILDLLLGFSQD